MELCRPAHLICENPEVAKKMTENLEKQSESGAAVDRCISSTNKNKSKVLLNTQQQRIQSCRSKKGRIHIHGIFFIKENQDIKYIKDKIKREWDFGWNYL